MDEGVCVCVLGGVHGFRLDVGVALHMDTHLQQLHVAACVGAVAQTCLEPRTPIYWDQPTLPK